MSDLPQIPPPPLGASSRAGRNELVIIPSPDHPELALVIGGATIPDRLGKVIATAPDAAMKTLQGAGALSQVVAAAGLSTGRWVQLTAESAANLQALGPSMNAAGTAMTGVLRSGTGSITQHLEFTPGVVMDPTGATLIAGLAIQATLARIERQLESLVDKVDLLLEHSQIEIEATLVSSLSTIETQERRLAGLGEVDADGWDALASVEADVRKAYHHVLRWLTPLRELLKVEDARVPELVTELKKSVELRDVAAWIRLYVWAELTMKRWELLYLVRQMTVAPDLIPSEAAHIDAEAKARRDSLHELFDDLTAFLERDPDDVDWRDRARFVNRYRLGVLRREVARVLNIYAETLGQAAVEVPEYLDPDGDAGTGPLLMVESVQQRLGRGANRAIEASVDTGLGALDLLSGLRGAMTDRVGDRLPTDRLPKGRWRRRPDDPDDPAS
ncbi:hypothetical protein DVS28_a0269 [Euzebya pacifica]|uniref:Uncharacterized protein n=1 Tax=Euzebya pacifica TaxID=1608957 RepID=A0A346XRX9_9ACTN|nr:hypothetical protein [Euzebya pacifica]AXV04976.1 hypothetical protein DVS28_a0269 [Euzebya pacifica]